MLTQGKLKQLLEYCPDTGVFVWRIKPSPKGSTKAGDVAGCAAGRYWVIKYRRRNYYAHRLAWLYMTGDWPLNLIDHKDGDGTNNRWRNLRDATHGQNTANQRLSAKNTSGFKGVRLGPSGTWHARISVKRKTVHLGTFPTAAAAHAAYVEAANEHYKEFANGGGTG